MPPVFKKQISLFFFFFFTLNVNVSAQVNEADSLKLQTYAEIEMPADTALVRPWYKKTAVKTVFVPAMLIGYGVSTIGENGLYYSSGSVQRYFQSRYKGFHSRVDDFIHAVPVLAVYGLNAAGVKGKHDFIDRSFLLVFSNVLNLSVVNAIKYTTRIQRPDFSTYNSFPSGHTSTAFVSAEFLHQEYKDVSLWYSVGGYTIASATGAMRILNNRHWLADVFTGAGIGMLSTRVTYLVYPHIRKHLRKISPSNTVIVPSFQGGSKGITLVYFIK